MIALVVAVFIASPFGSLHCAGMCGGLVTLCVGGEPVDRRRDWMPHLAYNGGRLATYAVLGAVSGALGAAIDLGGAGFGLPRAAAVIAGAAMILMGLAALLRESGMRLGALRAPAWMQALLRRGMSEAQRRPPVTRGLIVGLLTGLLPCGWLYAFVIAAAGTGSPWLGALTMAVFWSGTLPVMLTLGVGVQRLSGPLRRHVPTLTSIALVAVGIAAVVGRLDAPAVAADVPSLAAANPLAHVESIDHAELPCCADDAEVEAGAATPDDDAR
jgi:sulfite exporter TauE/SafE